MKARNWAGWIERPSGWTLVSAISVCAALYAFALVMHWFFGPLLHYEQQHYGFLLLDAAALTLFVTGSIHFVALRKARNSEERLRHAITTMRDAVIIADAKNRIVDWNPAAEQLFQFRRAEALDQSADRFLSPNVRFAQSRVAHTDAERAATDTTSSKPANTTIKRKNGETVPVEITTSAAPQHSDGRVVYVIRNVFERYAAQVALQENELQLRLATEMVGIATWAYDFNSREMFRSQNHDALFGLPWQKLWDLDAFLEAIHPDDRDRSVAIIQASLAPGGHDDYSFDFRATTPDGTVRWLWVKGRITEREADGRGRTARGVLCDISDRKDTEAKLERMTRLYAALSQCNQAIVRSSSEQELLPQICREAVSFGGFTMASISMLDPETQRVSHVAAYGSGIDYLENVEIRTDQDSSAGRGPTGTCIRENKPYWCQDYQRDPATAPWHAQGVQYGWRSSAALPLVRNGQVVGALSVYSDVLNAFDEDSKSLLLEMAQDVSFAMERFVDARQHQQAIEALRRSDERLRTIIENEPECVKVIGKDGALLEINKAGLAMLEIDTIENAKNYNLLDFVTPEHRETFLDLYRRVMNGETGSLEFEVRGLNGTHRWLETHAAPMRDSNGAIDSLLGVTRDVTERRHAESRIQYLANFDALTGLPNRNLLTDHIEYTIGLARHNAETLCVMFVDIDRFKDINDTLGHSLGDLLLVEVGKRLRSTLWNTDTVSRLGGDEFVVVLPDSGTQAAAHVAEKLLSTIARPYRVNHYELRVTASVGIAIYPNDGGDIDSLFRSADTAMYRAKQEGRNAYRFYTEEMQARAVRHMALSNAMRRAVELSEFELHYQPQLTIDSERIVGVEALLRWRNADFGDVAPTEFIPVAEYSGLLLPIGEWVMRTAVGALKEWIAGGHEPMVMAVNLSAIQFRDRNLPDLVSKILSEAQLPCKYLELELTESVAMNDPHGAISIMEKLHKLGLRMSIDDFGTGYSSLNYLKKFSVYKIKIDKSFVRGITSSEEDRAIVKAIISLSKSLGLRTIAEGVETAAQLAFLREQQCEEAQGYYFCKPLPADRLVEYLRSHIDSMRSHGRQE